MGDRDVVLLVVAGIGGVAGYFVWGGLAGGIAGAVISAVVVAIILAFGDAAGM